MLGCEFFLMTYLFQSKLTRSSGLETVFQFAHQHAKVYMGCRSESKGLAAISTIKTRVPDADIHLLIMDLTDLASVDRAAKEFIKSVLSLQKPKSHD